MDHGDALSPLLSEQISNVFVQQLLTHTEKKKNSNISQNMENFIEQSDILNPFQNNKILDYSKLKPFLDDKKKGDSKTEHCYGMSKKHFGKRRKYWLPTFSAFPTMFSEAFFFRVVKSRNCLIKS